MLLATWQNHSCPRLTKRRLALAALEDRDRPVRLEAYPARTRTRPPRHVLTSSKMASWKNETSQGLHIRLPFRGEVGRAPEGSLPTGPKRLHKWSKWMAAAFHHFGAAHVGAVVITLLAPLGLCAFNPSSDHGLAKTMNWSLAALLVGSEILKFILLYRDGELTVEASIPMHLCNWAAIAAMITLICPNQLTYELCYFWALAGTLQALLTPDLSYEFPDPHFVSFFTLHGGVIASALYMTACLGMRPVPMSIPRVLAWSLLYLATAMTTNFVFKTNFGYLRAKPLHPSVLDYMAPWPFYIPQLILLAILLCLVLYMPFFLLDHLRG